MPHHLPEDLLTRPVDEGIRLIALGHLYDATRARPRVDDPADAEALHDFRVALRRLRSCLRSYQLQLRSDVGRTIRRRLRRYARATGASRDLEVQIRWVGDQLPQLDAAETAAARQLLSYLRHRKAKADRRLRRRLATFDATTTRLERRLRRYQVHLSLHDAHRTPTALAIGRRVSLLNQQLGRALAGVEAVRDIRPAHEARIAAKHLRYLLEPVADGLAGGAEAIASLRALQDALGELHDAQLLLEQLERCARDSIGGAAAGLAALAPRVRARITRAFAAVQPVWLGGAATPLAARIGELADGLLQYGLPKEIERKYLLCALPANVAGVPALEIEQGWLPGAKIIERLRHVRVDGAELWYRTIKLGQGLMRTEVEEPIAPELFAALWSLTATLRITKRRYRIADSNTGLTWEIDEFLDRGLVLAEVELPSAGTVVRPPDWLAAYVVREVTEEPAFTNYQLARQAPIQP